MKKMRRVLALLLCIVMVVGLIPTSVFAAETPLAAAIFASDIHAKTTSVTGDNVSDTGVSTMKSIMSTIGENGITYNTIGFVGDTYTDIAGSEADMASVAQSALGQSAEVCFAYGDHDEESDISPDSGLMYTGDHYYIYHISDANMRSKVATQSEISYTDAIATFKTDAASMDKTKILFIMSHAPLHDRRDDNTYANDWYTAISAVADTMDVVVFWAHNHTNEDSTDRNAYYVASSYNGGTEEMTIYGGSTVVPNFTYMNAGYIYPNGQSSSSVMRYGVATTVEIYADEMVFQDYNSSGEYTNATYSHNVSVKRAFAAEEVTLSSIAISGTKTYYVGDELDLTVTATYSDGTTADVTAGAELSGYDMNTAGTYAVTATYEDLTATASITVNALQVNSIAVTTQPTKITYLTGEELDLTGMVVTATYNNGSTAAITNYYQYGSVDMTTVGEKTVTIAYSDNGTIFKATFTITVEQGVAEGVTLTGIEITKDPTKTEYLISEELKLDGMVVVATFSDGSTVELQYAPFSTSTVYGGYELDNFSMYVEKAHELVVTYTFGEVTCTDTTTINVWDEDFADENTGVSVSVAAGDYGVTAVNVADSVNENVAAAVADVIRGDAYKAYDITLVLDADTDADGNAVYALTNGVKTVTLPIPEGVSNPVVYFVSDDGATVTNMNAVKDGNGNVTFTTTHFSTYVIGENIEITVPENETATGSDTVTTTTTKTVYVLTSSISSGNSYLIADSASAGDVHLVANDGGDLSNTTATVVYGDCDGDGDSEYYIELTDATNELWTVSNSYQFENQGEYLRCSNGSLSVSSQSTTWSYSSNRLSYTSSSSGGGGNRPGQGSSSTTYYLRYNNGWTVTSSSSSASSIYFYVPTEVEVETETTVSGTYSIAGEDIVTVVEEGSQANLTSTLTFTPTSGSATTTDVSATATYEIVTVDAYDAAVDGDPNGIISSISGNTVTFTGNYGTALVKVSYTTDFGVVTDYITIEASAPYYTIELHEADLTKVTITEFAEGVTYYTFNETTNTYDVATSYVEGTTYYTTPVIQGDEITETIALKGIQAGDTYAVWAVVKEHTSADPDGVDMGALGNALTWTVSDTTIATIDTTTGVITFTGTNYGTFNVTVAYEGADGKVITDTITISVTDSLYVVPGDGTNDFPEYPNEGAVRFDKTATAVGNYSETGLALVELSMTGVPYTTGSAIDVLLMLDMSTSMDTEVATGVDRVAVTITAAKAFAKTIVMNDDGTYNDNKIAIKYFNGSSVYTTTDYISVSSDEELEALYTLIGGLYTPTATGTYYSTAMENAYNTVIAQDAVSDNTQALVFMSDGGPTYYTYLNDSGTGTTVESSTGATFVGWFDVDDNDTEDETDDTATPNSSFKTEYYSYKLKELGYPVYTVGLGLSTNDTGPQSYTGLTSGAHEAVTSYILSQMATNSSYFYNVADSDAVANMGNIFSGIAASIKEAATDIKVEDKIGSNYTVNFSLPGYGTGNVLDTNALDGQTNFYIQVVDYVLDATTHERTGVYSVLENFTFNFDGTLASHTVDGVECTDCSHVTFTDGVVTKIDGTYFDYESTTDGEYLNWEAEKLTSTELALQYFAYLDNSSGVAAADQVDPGTYYTNEYATLTYTNYNGNQVQQEFPVPQMTWYGAQVSYVFYLVNAAGQPVNRAGRVVPFAEAVYVTDVHTEAVVWNDLEQSAGLEAERLAEELVPEVYALYDDDATYNIHVYADEEGSNLNNHFVIGGNVGDDYNTVTNSWTNAKTTYVFNNKSDSVKYNEVGAYIANDGSDTTTTKTYLCKGSGTISGVTWTEVTLASDSDFVNGVYYYDVDGVKTRALTYTEGVTYYELTAASYAAVTGETQWAPGTGDSTTGGTVIGNYVYYVDENGQVYTIVQKSDGTEVRTGFDFANTTVAFAVVWKPQLETDTVVVDYGLDVVINVSMNDALASGVVGVRADAPANVEINKGTYESAKATSAVVSIDANSDGEGLKELKVGTATVENLTSVRFSLDKTVGTQFNKPAIFYYEADCNYYTYDTEGTATLNTTSMYSSVIVIPASTVYYEDEYVTLKTHTKNSTGGYDAEDGWDTSSVHASATQAVDRPGFDMITSGYDANNPYGYDGAYDNMSTYSMDNSAKITVQSGKFGSAQFTFYGTGFDIISLTSNDTGFTTVDIYEGAEVSGTPLKTLGVDTYYGYSYGMHEITWRYMLVDEEYKWVEYSMVKVDVAGDDETMPDDPAANETYVTYENRWYATPSDADNSLYQVPVISYEGLEYGQYTVYLKTAYNQYLDHTGNGGSYDFYLDAIRIYDPVASNTLVGTDKDGEEVHIEDIYAEDLEGWAATTELRSNIIDASKVTVVKNADGSLTATLTDGSETIQSQGGAVFIDGNTAAEKISDYVSYGPNNELYLANGQAVAFKVNPASKSGYEVADVQLGIKSANGGTVTYLINGDTVTLESTTDMYYSIKDYADDSIVITNNGDGVLSITNIKVTYKVSKTATSNEDAGVDTANLIYTDEDVVTFALMSLRPQAVEEDTSDKTENTTPETEDTTAGDKNTSTGSTSTNTGSSNTGSTSTDTDDTSTQVTVPETENSTTADTLQKEETVPEKHAPAKTEKPAPETENNLFNEDAAGEVQEESFWSMVLRKIVQALNWLFGWLKG